jgi:hypothetical protein
MLGTPSGLIDFAYVTTIDEPLMWEETIEGHNVYEWKKTTNEKYHALMKNETQVLTELHEGRTTVGSKWVFHMKRKANGDIDKY